VSHRALVAVARSHDRYDLHYSHDGGADGRLDRLRTRGLDPPADLLEGPLLGEGLSLEAVLADHLDPIEHEALVVVESDGGVRPFVVLPYVLATANGPRGVALALVGRDGSPLHPAFVRGWFQGTTGVLGEAVDGKLLTVEEAFGWLDHGVSRLAGDRHTLTPVP
jgi:hypothetical protein